LRFASRDRTRALQAPSGHMPAIVCIRINLSCYLWRDFRANIRVTNAPLGGTEGMIKWL
jgi:hypothetical protein